MDFQKLDLTKDYILTQITEEEIFKKYLNFKAINVHKKYTNPLREDSYPDCCFYYKHGRLRFNDFAWKIFDCFDVVQEYYNLTNFYDVLQIIARDFSLFTKGKSEIATKLKDLPIIKTEALPYTIRIKRKNFTKEELNWWIPNNSWQNIVTEKVLTTNKIYSIFNFWETIQNKTIEHSNLNMHFAYHWNKHIYQIYKPQERVFRRFFNSSGIFFGDIEFLNPFANYVLITKSKKDAFYARLCGINTCFVIGERVNSLSIIEAIRVFYFGEDIKIFTLLDNDRTGIKTSKVFKEKHKTITRFIRKSYGKDFTDITKKYNYDDLCNYIKLLKLRLNLKDNEKIQFTNVE